MEDRREEPKRLDDQNLELRQRLIAWYRDPYENEDSELPQVELKTDLESAWRAWTMLTVTGWEFLLTAGGVLDQPEALWDDVIQIEALHRWVKKALGKD